MFRDSGSIGRVVYPLVSVSRNGREGVIGTERVFLVCIGDDAAGRVLFSFSQIQLTDQSRPPALFKMHTMVSRFFCGGG